MADPILIDIKDKMAKLLVLAELKRNPENWTLDEYGHKYEFIYNGKISYMSPREFRLLEDNWIDREFSFSDRRL